MKRFKTRKMQIENIEKEKIDLTKSLKNVKKFKKITETAEKSFEENFKMKKENFN